MLNFNFDKIRNAFSFKPKSFLGIDIGTSTIRLTEITKKKGNLFLTNYGELKSSSFKKKPFRTFVKNNISLSNREISEGIKAIIEEASIATKDVCLSIPDFASFFTTFEIPKMDKDEVSQAIQYEVRPYVPIPINEVTLDWVIVEEKHSSSLLKVLVVAIPNDVVAQYQEIAQMADLDLKILESEVFSLVRAANNSFKSQEEGKKIIALIDVGSRSTTYSIIEQGVLKLSYSFNLGSNELTDVIAKSLNIDYNESEKLKMTIGLRSNGEKNIKRILLPLVDSIMGEGKEVFRSFFTKEGKKVDKIVLAGGFAVMPGLVDYFSESFKKPVINLDPFLNISYPKALIKAIKDMGPLYGVSVGSALKGLEKQ